MIKRKNDKANLDKIRGVFKGIGLTAICGLVLLAFSLKTYNKVSYDFKVAIDDVQDDLPPLIPPPATPPPPPPPPPPSAPPKEPEIEIVPDEEDVPEEEIDITEEQDIEIDEGPSEEEEEEELEPAPVAFASDMPHYRDCADGNNIQRTMCTKQKIDREIKRNIVVPDIAISMGYEGTVYIKFTVNTKGAIYDIQIIKGVNKVLDEAAISAVRKLPSMIPGKQLDKAVSVFFQVPVKFVIN